MKLGKEPDLVSAVGRLASDEKLQRQARAALVELQRAVHRIGRRRVAEGRGLAHS